MAKLKITTIVDTDNEEEIEMFYGFLALKGVSQNTIDEIRLTGVGTETVQLSKTAKARTHYEIKT